MRTSKPYLRFGVCHGRSVYVSSSVGSVLGERVDLYQNKDRGVYALVTAEDGEFRVGIRDGTGSRSIAAQCLCDLFSPQDLGSPQCIMPAWTEAGKQAVLFAARNKEMTKLDNSFHKVDFSQVSTCQTVFTPERTLAAGAYWPSACTAYEKGRILALVPTKRGSIIRVRRLTGGYHYDSLGLAEHCRKRWNSERIFRRQVGKAILLSSNLSELLDITDIQDFKPVPLNSSQPYIRMCRDRRIWFSPEALGVLGRRINVYISRDHLAFRRDPDGEIKLTVEDSSASIFLMQLYHMIVTYYAGAEYLTLAPRGEQEDLMVLCPKGDESGPFPVRQSFCRLLLQEPGHAAWEQMPVHS